MICLAVLVQMKARRAGGRERQLESLVGVQPGTNVLVHVGGVVVQDQVDLGALAYLAVDQTQECQELLVTVAGEALADPVSYTHLRAHETRHDLVCRLLLEKKKKT